MRIHPGTPYPLGATYDGAGTNFSLFSEVAERVELCLFDDAGPGDPGRAARGHRLLLARLPARRRARPALRLPGARAVGPRRTGTAATRPSCCSTPTPRRSRARSQWDEAVFPYHFDDPDGSSNDADSAPFMPRCGGHQPVLRLGQRPAAAHPVARDGHLRGARQGLHQAPPGHPRGAARHLRRPRPPGRHRPPQAARRHRRRAAAGPPVRPRQPPGRARACATTGATTRSATSPRTTSYAAAAASAASRCRSSSRW